MSNRSIASTKTNRESFAQALALLNNPEHLANRIAIAKLYREMMATSASMSNDPKAHQLLLVSDVVIAQAEAQSATLNRISK